MAQIQLSDRQSNFIFYLVHHGKGCTKAARLAGFAAPRQSAFTLTQITKDHQPKSGKSETKFTKPNLLLRLYRHLKK